MSVDPQFFEKVLIKFLFERVDVCEKVFPFLNVDIFSILEHKNIVTHVLNHHEKYEKFPSKNEIKATLIQDEDLSRTFDAVLEVDLTDFSDEFLFNNIEEFIRGKLVYNLLLSSASKLSDKEFDKLGNLPDEIRDAISFSFNTNIGLDLLSHDAEDEIYDSMHNKDRIISSGLKSFDALLGGGFHEKSLNVFLAATNVGKTLIMCALAKNILLQNKNVLYISFEISKHQISNRILSNIFDVKMDDMKMVTRDKLHEKFDRYRSRITSKLIVEEFPTSTVNSNQVRAFIRDLYAKRGFKPDIIFLDYIGIMLSNKSSKNDNSYQELKRVCQEVRGIGCSQAVPMVTGAQTNRGGIGASFIDLSDVADSLGVATESDVVIGATQTDEQAELGRFLWSILKNRFGLKQKSIVVGVDTPKMRLYDIEDFCTNQVAAKPPDSPKEEVKIATPEPKIQIAKKKEHKPVIFDM